MFRDDEKLGTTIVAHEELSKILREMDSIASTLRSVVKAVEQTAIIGQDVRHMRHRLDEVVSRRDVTAIHRELGGVEFRIRRIEAHMEASRTPKSKGSQTAKVALRMELMILF